MFLSIEVTVNVLLFPAIAILSFAAGYLIHLARQRSIRKSLESLEQDMLNNHAEILRLQKELAGKEGQTSQTPIVPIRDSSGMEVSKKGPGDSPMRKKIIQGKK